MLQTGIFTGYFPYGLEETARKVRAHQTWGTRWQTPDEWANQNCFLTSPNGSK